MGIGQACLARLPTLFLRGHHLAVLAGSPQVDDGFEATAGQLAQILTAARGADTMGGKDLYFLVFLGDIFLGDTYF